MFGVQFESHRLGAAADGKGGGHGAAKRKRGFGDSMDTEAVQTTLEAMRIQVRLPVRILWFYFPCVVGALALLGWG